MVSVPLLEMSLSENVACLRIGLFFDARLNKHCWFTSGQSTENTWENAVSFASSRFAVTRNSQLKTKRLMTCLGSLLQQILTGKHSQTRRIRDNACFYIKAFSCDLEVVAPKGLLSVGIAWEYNAVQIGIAFGCFVVFLPIIRVVNG